MNIHGCVHIYKRFFLFYLVIDLCKYIVTKFAFLHTVRITRLWIFFVYIQFLLVGLFTIYFGNLFDFSAQISFFD